VGGFAVGTITSTGASGNDLAVGFDALATPALVSTLIRALTYSNSNTANPSTASRTISVTVNDGDGGSDTETVTVGLTAVNDDPSGAGAPTSTTVIEDVASNVNLSGISLTDVDSGSGTVTLKIVASAGTLSAVTAGGVTPSVSGLILTLTGTVANLDAYLNTVSNIKYTTAANVFGTGIATLTLSVNDSGNTGTGGGTDIALGTVSIDAAGVNDAPTLIALGNSPTFAEGDAAVDLFDSPSASTIETGQTFKGLTLTVSNVTNGTAEILTLDGSDIALTNGNAVTTLTNGLSVTVSVAANTATVSFTGATLTAAQLQQLVDLMSYRNTSDDPTDANRIVTLTEIVDSGGTALTGDDSGTLAIAATVDVNPVNDEPTLTATALNPTFTEGGAAADVFTAPILASTIELGQNFTSLRLTVTNVTDGASETLVVGGLPLALVDGSTVTAFGTATVTMAGTTATVVLSGAPVSAANLQVLVDALAYANSSDNPTAGDRVITITQVTDSGSSTSPNDNTTALSIVSTVTVDPVNDAALITGVSTGGVTEAGGLSNTTPGIPTATGNLDSTDVDGVDDAWTPVTVATSSTGGYGTYTVDAAGAWTYTLDDSNATVQALNGVATLLDSFTVATADGTTQQVSVTINAQNDAPLLDLDASAAGSGFLRAYIGSGAPVSVADTDMTLIDPDSSTVASAVITLTNAQAGDVLQIVGALPGGIAVAVVTGAGSITVTLFNPASAADYAQAIRQVAFSNPNPVPSAVARDIAIVVNDGVAAGNVAHTTIQVSPFNFAPTAVSVTPTGPVAENTPNASGIVVGTIAVTDDGQGTNTLGLAGADALFFEIVGDQLRFKAGVLLDFEGKSSYEVSVTAEDGSTGGAPVASAPVTIAVTDVNEGPSVTLDNTLTALSENASTASARKVADIVVTDDALGSETLSLSGTDAGLFEIVGTSLFLRKGAALDFETNPTLDVTVNVNDAALPGIEDSALLSLGLIDGPDTIGGTSRNDRLLGTNDGETLLGLGGNDRILARGGDDTLVGGRGADILTGGAGRDTFRFTSVRDTPPGHSELIDYVLGHWAGRRPHDVITDFARGWDKIDLSAIDANSKIGGNQAFKFKGNADFSNKGGELIYHKINVPFAADRTMIYGDVNGDGRADFQIELSGLHSLRAVDFIL
jgi:VCBS repeat-containing protein